MYDHILLPIDGTESLSEVFPHTLDAADRRDATVHLLYVVDDRAFLTLADGMREEVIEEFRSEGEAAIDEAESRFADEGVETTTELRRGNPVEEILDYIDTAPIDLVTMGTHDDDSQESVVGSVSQKVVKRAPVPVLTVKIE
ncbi:universal stress protein [Halorientalis marina]|jgi:nucleotide-binding universal stress UspA family protein|uniref:universal stress protein n=1 Tax=Halorientalis marina TaxID=2931976 RepID=UPI001FF2FF3C|nr:universal stress protein [Halorientalis marina]